MNQEEKNKISLDAHCIKRTIKEIVGTYTGTALWQLAASSAIYNNSIDPYSRSDQPDAWKLAALVGTATIVPNLGLTLHAWCQKIEPATSESRSKKIVTEFNELLSNFFTAGLWQIFYNLSRRHISPRFVPNSASVGGLSAVVGLVTQVLFLKTISKKTKIVLGSEHYYRDRVLQFIACFCISMAFVLTDSPELTDYFLSSCLPDNSLKCHPLEDGGKAGLTGLIGLGAYYIIVLTFYALYLFTTDLMLPGMHHLKLRCKMLMIKSNGYGILIAR